MKSTKNVLFVAVITVTFATIILFSSSFVFADESVNNNNNAVVGYNTTAQIDRAEVSDEIQSYNNGGNISPDLKDNPSSFAAVCCLLTGSVALITVHTVLRKRPAPMNNTTTSTNF